MNIPWQQRRPVNLSVALGYGAGDFYGGGQGVLISTYLLLFWTKFCHMDIASAQSLLGVSAIISAFAALFFGVLNDNLYHFRVARVWGRRHVFMMIVSPLILAGLALWVPGLNFAVYAIVYVIWVILGQVFQTAYSALPGEMTHDFSQRTMLSTARMFISSAAGTLIPLVGSAVFAVMGEENELGYMAMAWGFTISFAIATALCCVSTWELTPSEAGFSEAQVQKTQPQKVQTLRGSMRRWMHRGRNIAAEYLSTLRIRAFRQHLALYLLILTASDIFGQTAVFFMLYNWGQTTVFASLILSMGIISLPLMQLFGWGMVKIGPRKMYSIGFAGGLVGSVLLVICWLMHGRIPEKVWMGLAVAAMLWFIAFKALYGYLPWAIFPFIADIDQIVTRRSRSATFLGVQSFLRQLFSGIAMIGSGFVLSATGFDASHKTQTGMAQIGIAVVFLGFTVVALLVCWVVNCHFSLDQHSNGIILREIARLQSGGAKDDVTPETRAVVEQLTGLAYEECWNG